MGTLQSKITMFHRMFFVNENAWMLKNYEEKILMSELGQLPIKIGAAIVITFALSSSNPKSDPRAHAGPQCPTGVLGLQGPSGL